MAFTLLGVAQPETVHGAGALYELVWAGASSLLVSFGDPGREGKGSHQKKSTFLSDIVKKGGGVQPESKSFEVVFNSPGVAGAVLQTPPSLID